VEKTEHLIAETSLLLKKSINPNPAITADNLYIKENTIYIYQPGYHRYWIPPLNLYKKRYRSI
jgi:hypothetical protein